MRTRAVILLLAAALVFVLPALLDFVADWLWFGEVGYRDIYATSITAKTLIGASTFAIAMLWHVRSRVVSWPAMRAMSGSRSPRRRIIPGAACPITG